MWEWGNVGMGVLVGSSSWQLAVAVGSWQLANWQIVCWFICVRALSLTIIHGFRKGMHLIYGDCHPGLWGTSYAGVWPESFRFSLSMTTDPGIWLLSSAKTGMTIRFGGVNGNSSGTGSNVEMRECGNGEMRKWEIRGSMNGRSHTIHFSLLTSTQMILWRFIYDITWMPVAPWC